MTEPDWVRHAIWWHVYPLGAVGAYPGEPPGPDEHRLRRLVSWLDHVVALGASGLLLGPVFASTTHGYDTVDHLRIDPRLGDDTDFDDLVAEAHGRGVKVLLDGVFNHVGRDSAIARRSVDALEGRSDDEVWLLRDADGAFVGFEGHGALVTLDHAHPSVVDYVVRVMNHWLDRGADGWRLDAAYAVPTTFWAQVLPRVRAEHPDAWFVAEVIHGDYPAFVQESTVDSVTQYELWKAIWSSLTDAQPVGARVVADAARRVPRVVRAPDVRRQPRHHPDRQHDRGPAPPGARGRRALHGRRDPDGLRGRRAGVHRREGGTGGWRRRGPPGARRRRTRARRGPGAPPAPGPDRPAASAPVAAPRADHAGQLTNTTFVYEVRDGDDALLVALNLDDEPLARPAARSSRATTRRADGPTSRRTAGRSSRRRWSTAVAPGRAVRRYPAGTPPSPHRTPGGGPPGITRSTARGARPPADGRRT